ncbi:MAG: hypothetical protein EBW40_10760, partial [Gammaproteobacteria bacterium]|nr:hypothetical protein [Gammaproteobacteria bacterium]
MPALKKHLIHRIALGIALVLCPFLVSAQETNTSDLAQKEQAVRDLQTRFDVDFSKLQIYEQVRVKTSQAEEDALLYRRDSEALALLSRTGKMAQTLADLPENNATRIEVESQLRQRLAGIDTLIIGGLERLNRRIDEARARVPSLKGVDQFQARAQISSLQDLRYKTMRAMAEIFPTLEMLGIPYEDFRRQAE